MNGEGSQYSGLSVLWYQQGGAELDQAQVKLEVLVKVGVEDRWCIYLILREF